MSEYYDRNGKIRPMWEKQSVQSTEIGRLNESSFLPEEHVIRFEKLYGGLTIPGSEYFMANSDKGRGTGEMLIGRDSRPVVEIYRQIEPILAEAQKTFCEKRIDMGNVRIAKELQWTKDLRELNCEDRKDYTERFILWLKEEGISLTDTVLIDADLWEFSTYRAEKENSKLMKGIAAELKNSGYRFEERPHVAPFWGGPLPREPCMSVEKLRGSSHAYVGELVLLERKPNPCKTA